MTLQDITVDELAQIIRKVDGNHSLGAAALAEAILSEIDKRQAAKKDPAPSRQQMAVLKWIIGHGGPVSTETIPRSVAWYTGDVIKRMVARGWLAHSRTHHGCYEVTDAGKEQVQQ